MVENEWFIIIEILAVQNVWNFVNVLNFGCVASPEELISS